MEADAERCSTLSRAAILAVQRDAINFEALLKAHGHDQLPAMALEGDAQVLTAIAAEIRKLVGRHRRAVDAHLVGDIDAALALVGAFEQIQTENLLGG